MKRGLQAVQQRCQPSDWRNGLIFFFGCFGSGGSGGGSKPWQRAAIAQSRNLPTNPCLWLGLWRCMSLLDISCQLALGTLDSILLVHSLSSDCLGWCRRCKPLQCLFMGGTQSLILKVKNNCLKKIVRAPQIQVWRFEVKFKVFSWTVFTIYPGKVMMQLFIYSSLLQNSRASAIICMLHKQIHTRADREHLIFLSLKQLEENNINRLCGL